MLDVPFHDRPLIVFWEATKACALACVHCRARAHRRRDPTDLTTREALDLVEDVARFGAPVPRLVVTGGDPLERPDLVEIVAAARAAGVPVALAPAATPKLTRRSLEELRNAGAWGVAISVDAATAATHDDFRRSRGAFARALDALRDARDVGLVTQVNTVAHRGNLADLPAILRLTRDVGAAAWEVIPLIATGRAERLPPLAPREMECVLHFLHDAGAYGVRVHAAEAPASRRVAIERGGGAPPPADALYRELIAPLRELGPPRPSDTPLGRTRSGHGVVFVGADGAVTPSGFLPATVGNVREASLREIYRNAPLMRALREPSGFRGACGTCDLREICGGSRARAFAATGDPLASDPSCVRVARTVEPNGFMAMPTEPAR